MTLFLAIVILIFIVSFVLMAWAAMTAPSGWEDETGFHQGMKE